MRPRRMLKNLGKRSQTAGPVEISNSNAITCPDLVHFLRQAPILVQEY